MMPDESNWHTGSLDQPSVVSLEDEEARERKFYSFETACIEFAKSERDGFAAVLRAVARAMKDQGELLR